MTTDPSPPQGRLACKTRPQVKRQQDRENKDGPAVDTDILPITFVLPLE